VYAIRDLMSRIWDVRFFLECADFHKAMDALRELYAFGTGKYSQSHHEKREQCLNDLRLFREKVLPSGISIFIHHPFRFIAWMFKFKIEEYGMD